MWKKSSLSYNNGYVEVDLDWKKSSRSGVNGCVEVDLSDHLIGVRDSKNRGMGELYFSKHEWQVFIDSVKNGEFDLPKVGA